MTLILTLFLLGHFLTNNTVCSRDMKHGSIYIIPSNNLFNIYQKYPPKFLFQRNLKPYNFCTRICQEMQIMSCIIQGDTSKALQTNNLLTKPLEPFLKNLDFYISFRFGGIITL